MKQAIAIVILAGSALAQDPAPSAPKPAATAVAAAPAEPVELPDDAVVATLNGRKFSAGELRSLIGGLPAQAQTYIKQNPQQFLSDHAYFMLLEKYAESRGLDKKGPYKEALEFQRMVILMNAAVNDKMSNVEVRAEEQQKYFDDNKARYRELRVRMIYFPFTDPSNEEASKKKAEEAVKRARGGEDFVTLAKELSEDSTGAGGDFPVRANSSQPPAHMKEVLFQQKPGAVTDPIRHDNGYYVFKVDSDSVLPFDKVRDEIYKAIQDESVQKWQAEIRQKAIVQMHNEAFFKSVGGQQ